MQVLSVPQVACIKCEADMTLACSSSPPTIASRFLCTKMSSMLTTYGELISRNSLISRRDVTWMPYIQRDSADHGIARLDGYKLLLHSLHAMITHASGVAGQCFLMHCMTTQLPKSAGNLYC